MFYSNIEFDNAYLQIYITLDPQIDEYQRTVYSFLDMFGFIGGIFELLSMAGYIVVNFFIKKSYYSSIISKIYHIESEQNRESFNSLSKNQKSYHVLNQFKPQAMVENQNESKIAPRHFISESSNNFKQNKGRFHEEVKSDFNLDNSSNNAT